MTSDDINPALDYLSKHSQGCKLRLDGTHAAGHGARVGLILSDKNFDFNTVCAGILHDLVEDTHVTVADIWKEFGPDVAKLVQAVSHDPRKSGKKRKDDLLQRVEAGGINAVAIKVADNSDNIRTISFLGPIKAVHYLRYAKKIQALSCKYLGEQHALTLHHLSILRDAQIYIDSLSTTTYAVR